MINRIAWISIWLGRNWRIYLLIFNFWASSVYTYLLFSATIQFPIIGQNWKTLPNFFKTELYFLLESNLETIHNDNLRGSLLLNLEGLQKEGGGRGVGTTSFIWMKPWLNLTLIKSQWISQSLISDCQPPCTMAWFIAVGSPNTQLKVVNGFEILVLG